jgi:hypothetical protein
MTENLNPTVLILIAGLAVVVGVALWMFVRKQRTEKLRGKFGPEYDKAVNEHQDVKLAESDLEKRVHRVAQFHIHPMSVEDRARFSSEWNREQSRFVDDPRAAVEHADTLVQQAMQARGYPVSDFEQNASDLSVEHPGVVDNYRIAHQIAVRDRQGLSNTEDLRKAMVSYRALFEDLLGQPAGKPEEVRR